MLRLYKDWGVVRMGLIDAMKKALGRVADVSAHTGPAQNDQRENHTEHEETRVPEVTATELMAELGNSTPQPLLLDCREPFERAQGFIPESLHIPMNTIPSRLAELKGSGAIVVYCAHGNRSHGVAGWLIQQGYTARSLKGGIVDWQLRGGPVGRHSTR